MSIWSHTRIEIFKIQSCWKVTDNDRVHVLVCFIIFFCIELWFLFVSLRSRVRIVMTFLVARIEIEVNEKFEGTLCDAYLKHCASYVG